MRVTAITFATAMVHITLLSDFGLQDASVASAKGLLMQQVPDVLITDISHMIEPFHVQQAAYLLNAAFRAFPAGSFHMVLCDIFSNAEPRMLLCLKDDHYFIAPDNGILSLAFNESYDSAWVITEPGNSGRLTDILNAAANAINAISKNGSISPLALQQATISERMVQWQPKRTGNTIECHVIHIDRFENVVINITRQQFEAMGSNRKFRIQFARNTINNISNSYSDVPHDEMLCRFNSTGYLEIAINRGKAASLLGLKLSKEEHLIYSTIKIVFE